MIWLCIISVLSITVISGQNINTSRIRVFPALNSSIAGIFQASSLNAQNQLEYFFNASEARTLCLTLGVNIASKAQVQEALRRGLETCRFGWIDEHFAVIPRIRSLSNCGQNQKGLVTWRASVKQKFDVFCFNESDAARQLEDATSDSLLSTRDYSGKTNATQTTHLTPFSSNAPSEAPKLIYNVARPARYVGSAEDSAGAKIILITSTCAVLLVAMIILAYIKLRNRFSKNCDWEKQQESLKTADSTCVNIMESKEDAQEHGRREVEENAS
ncbi:lymphatic vessel endothelial hyaluronic acid receptor 1a [Echeneis naucrates]|uniref:Link domain-containing protein n=1 Tax=Echeneis naucrates TaxID=173247 RepID=A0A665URG0_ECHNA|nr:lymphatic vessel endothelial hyaluronic acid receptor 1 [Echeneis naucrates]